MSNPIDNFLAARLAEKSKNVKAEKRAQLESEFEKRRWVFDAARRARQLSVVTHPGKFSHPDSKISSVLFQGESAPDGLVRSGNVRVQTDVVGNAAALDVFAFLMLILEDGRTVLDHFRDLSVTLRGLLGFEEEDYSEVSKSFLQIEAGSIKRSSTLIKQVYFPCNGDYHLLSIVTPSGIVSANFMRVQASRFSEEAKEARDAKRKNLASKHTIMDFPDKLTMHFGGTKPQNISKLNSNNRGRTFLFRSTPPDIASDYLRVPHNDFFAELRWDSELHDLFARLHGIISLDFNNSEIRRRRELCIEQIAEWLMMRAYLLQDQTPGWSDKGRICLPESQVLWLDRKYFDKRANNLSWSEEVDRWSANWILMTYRKMHSTQHVELGRAERDAFQSELQEFTRLTKLEGL